MQHSQDFQRLLYRITITSTCMQVASSEWVLGVQIQHFENMYNAEIIDGKYCCCDDDDVMCQEDITYLGMCRISQPNQACDSYFRVYVRVCLNNGTCSVTKSYQLNGVITSLNQVVLNIPISEPELSNQVRIKLSYSSTCCNITNTMKICKYIIHACILVQG